MSHVINGKCLGERYGTCVDVCPTESMHIGDHEGSLMMVINPETCIDCGACIVECPIGAIVGTVDEAPEWAEWNATASAMWPVAAQARDDWEQRDRDEKPFSAENAA